MPKIFRQEFEILSLGPKKAESNGFCLIFFLKKNLQNDYNANLKTLFKTQDKIDAFNIIGLPGLPNKTKSNEFFLTLMCVTVLITDSLQLILR